MDIHYTTLYFFMCWVFSIAKREALVSSPVFMSRTFLIFLIFFPFSLRNIASFSPFLSFHSANVSRHLFREDTVLGFEGQADGPVLVLSLQSHERRQMELRQCGQAGWGKGWHKRREEKQLWFMPFGRNSWKKVYLR